MYDKRNQLLGEYRTGTNAYRQTFAYDDASNRTLKNVDAVRTTTWNYENQPTLYLLPTGSSVTMSYNGDNHRIQIQEP